MVKKSAKKSKSKSNGIKDVGSSSSEHGGAWLYVDPARIRYQHARIRPYFSGCGRSVVDTLEELLMLGR
jgi:hypothetical protein